MNLCIRMSGQFVTLELRRGHGFTLFKTCSPIGEEPHVDDGAHVMKRIEERRETFLGDVHQNEPHNNEDEIDTGK